MFVKNILLDSFKELKPVLKNWKLIIVTLIMISIQLFLYKTPIFGRSFISELLLVIIGSFFLVYQYIAIAISINTKEKNLYSFFEVEKFNFGISLINFLISSFRILVMIIILVLIIPNFAFVLNFLIAILNLNTVFPILNPIAYIAIICFILLIPIIRYYLFIPLAILGNVFNPLKYSKELSKGKFWKLTLIVLCTVIFSLQNLLISLIIKNSNYLILVVYVVLTVISVSINTLISINSLYYFTNKEPKETSDFETV